MQQAVSAMAMFCKTFAVAAAGASPGPGSMVSRGSTAAPKDIAICCALLLVLPRPGYQQK